LHDTNAATSALLDDSNTAFGTDQTVFTSDSYTSANGATSFGLSGLYSATLSTTLRSGSFDIYQLDATAYPGNSGGPVVDADSGRVIAVINMVLVKGSKETAIRYPSGISYAVPVRFVSELLKER